MNKQIKMANGNGGKLFDKACELAETKPTRRQLKKWSRGYGKAFAFRNSAISLLLPNRL